MDPISVIVAALAAGAAAGVKPTAEQAIKDAYAGLKGFIQRKWDQVNVAQLEANPASEARRTVVEEDLAQTDAAKDRDLLALADTLLEAVSRHAPDAAKSVGVRLEDIKGGGSLRIHSAAGNEIGVYGKKWDIQEDIDISDVRGGANPQNPPVRQ
jgi:hypothetical protein